MFLRLVLNAGREDEHTHACYYHQNYPRNSNSRRHFATLNVCQRSVNTRLWFVYDIMALCH